MPPVNFVGGSYTLRALPADAQKTVNFYVETVESKQGKTPVVLLGTPGLKLFAAIGLPAGQGIRGNGLYTTHADTLDRCFIAAGNDLYEVTAYGELVQRGFFLTSQGPVSMADNGLYLVIVDGYYGYSLNLQTNLFRQIIDPNFPGADRVQTLDHYLLFNRPLSNQFFWTDLNNINFDALDFASVDGFPDRLVSLLVQQREIWLFGATTTERWMNVGDLLNPFQRIQGGFSEQGIVAIHSVAAMGSSAHLWLSANQEGHAMVFLMRDGQLARVSTHATEAAWQNYYRQAVGGTAGFLQDALAWGEQRDGHEFYWLTFPSGNATWVFDLTSGLWHERAYLNPETGMFERHRANAHTFAFGLHLVGDWENGNVYILDERTYDDNGAPLLALRRAPYVFQGKGAANLPWVHHHTLQVDCQMGVGGDTGQGSDPQLMMRWSDDATGTWSEERRATLGQEGQRLKRAYFRRLGRSRSRIYEVSISDPVPRAILGAYLEMEVANV